MGTSITLAEWSDRLQAEVFADATGDGRPVTTLLVDDELLRRALVRDGVDADANEARRMFLGAFPERDVMLGWFGGTLDPGSALVAFLVLCCFAASEAAESDSGDYRRRLAELLGWGKVVTNCVGLPPLWRRLENRVSSKAPGALRPFKLPDPGFRTQIGHAVELTFPSRPDAGKLRTALARQPVQEDKPAEVLSWLARTVRAGRFSESFRSTFDDFETAWRAGDRALSDHRFWTGWLMVIAVERESHGACPFELAADEWGAYRLVTSEDEPYDLVGAARSDRLPSAVARIERDGRPFFLDESEWARWRWTGSDAAGMRRADAALINRKSYSEQRMKAFDLAPVAGADGWAFTRSIDLLLTSDQRAVTGANTLLDVTFSGAPRLDGGILGRPLFPIHLLVSGPNATLTVTGEGANELSLERIDPARWLARFRRPLRADLMLQLASPKSGSVSRALRPRASALRPKIPTEIPSRYADDEPATPPTWAPTTTSKSPIEGGPRDLGVVSREPVRSEVSDLLEYFAARPGPVGLGSALELVGTAAEDAKVDRWDVLRALVESGALLSLRNRGWRGRAVVAAPPRGVVRQSASGWVMIIDGLVHETLVARLQGGAGAAGLSLERRCGTSPWGPCTFAVRSSDPEELQALAAGLELPISNWRNRLDGLSSIVDWAPDGDGRAHGVRAPASDIANSELRAAGVSITLWQREADDGPRLWKVESPNHDPRYWRLRHHALLDACLVARIPAFELDESTLSCRIDGAYLPLQVARWLRFASGLSSGPSRAGYAYSWTAGREGELRRVLGGLLINSVSEVVPGPPEPRRAHGGRVMAWGYSGGGTMETWRWARARRRGQA